MDLCNNEAELLYFPYFAHHKKKTHVVSFGQQILRDEVSYSTILQHGTKLTAQVVMCTNSAYIQTL